MTWSMIPHIYFTVCKTPDMDTGCCLNYEITQVQFRDRLICTRGHTPKQLIQNDTQRQTVGGQLLTVQMNGSKVQRGRMVWKVDWQECGIEEDGEEKEMARKILFYSSFLPFLSIMCLTCRGGGKTYGCLFERQINVLSWTSAVLAFSAWWWTAGLMCYKHNASLAISDAPEMVRRQMPKICSSGCYLGSCRPRGPKWEETSQSSKWHWTVKCAPTKQAAFPTPTGLNKTCHDWGVSACLSRFHTISMHVIHAGGNKHVKLYGGRREEFSCTRTSTVVEFL